MKESVTNMHSMFSNATAFNQNINSWDTSNVTEMVRMFDEASLFNQDLSSWDVANVVSCQSFSRNTSNWTLPKPNFTSCTP